MIVTLTANPSIDRTIALDGPLARGAVHRARRSTTEPGGKGVNVARVAQLAGAPTIAVLPAHPADPIRVGLTGYGISFRAVDAPEPARTNVALTEPGGTTTKINDPGPTMTDAVSAGLRATLVELARTARWVALCGSLPPGVSADWYADLVAELRGTGAKIAVDTSDAALRALADRFDDAAPDVIKPNSEELAQLTGADADELERTAAAGDLGPTAAAATMLVERGVGAVLATLGAAGAVLATADGCWFAAPPPVTAVSTVGAGDSSLAGYLLADLDGADAPARLARAVAYGAAAASLPGTTLPAPVDAHPELVDVAPLPRPSPAVPSPTPLSPTPE